ncbi:MAG: O-methyltransferase [Terriglobia bacterium]
MSGITDAKVERYLYGLLPARDPVLAEIERTAKRRNIPIVGPAVGRLLYQYAQLIGARRIFEMGSAIGYSTIWLARAAGPEARVYYSDGDSKNAEEAQGYFERAGVRNRIEVLVGNSLELIERVEGEFDLIFNDVDKHYYPEVLRRAVPRLRRGGLFITDNVFWSGRVTRRAADRNTRGIQEFNRLLYASRELWPTLLPLRDGLAVCHKL